ncbi:NAD-dependent epimerase/dehydratase family protein [Candidatus Micrarchaeota archaeon]|nr:NAD-dependent epimerase/dehydratase family protein [Candidatus Micrarchaeota archaeon]
MILVTGGAGFIGSHLCDRLNAVALDDLSSSSKEFVSGELVEADVCDAAAVLEAVEGAEAVFHFAAAADVRQGEAEPKRVRRVNVEGTRTVLEACRDAGVPRFVLASTAAVYGSRDAPAGEEASLNPESRYAASKAEAESLARGMAGSNLGVTVLRLGNVFGPRSRRGVMYDFFRKLQGNASRLEILGDGRQTKSYVYVSDVVDAVLCAFENQEKNFEVYNVKGHDCPVDDVARAVCKAMGLDPVFSFTGGAKGWKGDVSRTRVDGSKLEALGWKQKTGFEEGVTLYVDWLEKNG